MYKEIKLRYADGTSGEIGFLANAATTVRFRQTFQKDLMESFTKLINQIGIDTLKKLEKIQRESEEINLENLDQDTLQALMKIAASDEMQTVSQMAYVMCIQAQNKNNDIQKIMSWDDYFNWLERFDPLELTNHTVDFISIYYGNTTTLSTAKKELAQLSEK